MEDKVRVTDLDFVYISFKEPNKEENWADLLSKVPWAKRVDGVVGFDNAHKAAAEKAETDFFISVDGDNIIDESFLLQTLDFSKTNKNAVHRWRAKNSVNGLTYGNGGLVGWPKETCLRMKTHENAEDEKAKIDFCWTVPHENLHNVYSETIINATAQQAFVAGYREGVKMSLDQGQPIKPSGFGKKLQQSNLRNLLVWMTIGADVDNGKYAMLGARTGCYATTIRETDILKVRDLDLLTKQFIIEEIDVEQELQTYGESLRQQLDIPVAEYNEQQSEFFKFCMPRHTNKGVQDREYK